MFRTHDDEMLHEVTISGFYIDPLETLQSGYEALMGSDPSIFDGDDLPVMFLDFHSP